MNRYSYKNPKELMDFQDLGDNSAATKKLIKEDMLRKIVSIVEKKK